MHPNGVFSYDIYKICSYISGKCHQECHGGSRWITDQSRNFLGIYIKDKQDVMDVHFIVKVSFKSVII